MTRVILTLVGVALALPVLAQEYGEPGYPEVKALWASYQQFCHDQDTYSAANDPDGDAGSWCIALENAANNTAGIGIGGIERHYLALFPQGRYANEARRLLQQVAQRRAQSDQWVAARARITALVESYQDFCRQLTAEDYPGAAIAEHLEHAEWCTAIQTMQDLGAKISNTPNFFADVVEPMLGGYLRVRPQGRYAAPARHALGLSEASPAPPARAAAPPASPAPRTTGERYYVAVAMSPSHRESTRSGEPMVYGLGWHSDSSHDAAREATRVCRSYDASAFCSSGAHGRSPHGGCVALAVGDWQDEGDDDAFSAYTAGSAPHRDWAEQDALRECQNNITGGKPAGGVARWRCEILATFCSSDVQPSGPAG